MKDIVNDAILSSKMSFFDLVIQADSVVKLVLFILLAASIFSWSIIFNKVWAIRKQIKKADGFEKDLWSGKLIEDLYEQVKNDSNSFIAQIFISGIREFKENKSYKSDIIYSLESKRDNIYQSMRLECNRALDDLEKNVGFLAIIGSAAPFVGLFGTVWGIMSSFQAITVSHSTSLTVVAPSIAEALLATAVGLIVAIPATIFYNKFMMVITRFANRMNNFISEFGLLLIKEIE